MIFGGGGGGYREFVGVPPRPPVATPLSTLFSLFSNYFEMSVDGLLDCINNNVRAIAGGLWVVIRYSRCPLYRQTIRQSPPT